MTKRKLAQLGLLLSVLLGAFALVMLRSAGDFLSSPASPPRRSDVIVMLGGDDGARVAYGLKLFRDKFAEKLLLTSLEGGEASVQKYYLNWRAQVLIDGGVNPRDIEVEAHSLNSWEEAAGTLRLARTRNWRTIMVVSDPPHMRRLKWVWGKTFRGTGIEIILVGSHPAWWDSRRWWRNEQSAKFVLSEYVKIFYYLFKY